MLQQTQVSRVVPKYQQFTELFPDFYSLTQASAAQILHAWQGLGYNRRALFLQRLAHVIVNDYGGTVPSTVEELERLPGIGPATARSIAAFAYNEPTVFIETNVRRVFIHHFFPTKQSVTDQELLPLVAATVSSSKTREWYWALMDYGTFLATTTINPNRRSRHYVRQSRFEGSRRQARGAILRILANGPQTAVTLAGQINRTRAETQSILGDLASEGFVVTTGKHYQLKN